MCTKFLIRAWGTRRTKFREKFLLVQNDECITSCHTDRVETRRTLGALSLFPSDGKSYIVSKPDRMEDPSNFWPNVPIFARVLSPGSVVEWKSGSREAREKNRKKGDDIGIWSRPLPEVKGVSLGFIDYSSILRPHKLAQFLHLSKKSSFSTGFLNKRLESN